MVGISVYLHSIDRNKYYIVNHGSC